MRRSLFVLASLLVFVCPAAALGAAEEARLMRFADIHDDKIAFVYAGDLWIVPSSGGTARRLTSHEGNEVFPKFSPDGRWIAFSGEYAGNRQVHVISVDGGMPRQLTFYNDVGPMPPRGGFDYRVLDWTPDGKHVLFRANRLPWGVRMGRPYLVPFEGGMERPLAVPETGGAMFSPDGTRLVYTPIDREFRTWKRHRGGRAQDVWIYDLERDSAEQITDFAGTDNQPVWVEDTIYFTSDRERRLNLYAYDQTSRKITKVTQHEDFDVLWPSAGPRQIVYECGGQLYRFDPAEGRSSRVPVRISGDFVQTLPRYVALRDFVAGGGISPTGKRAVVSARGDLFTIPAKDGRIRNLTRSPGVREMDPVWSPDGKTIAYLSDRSGEYEVYLRNHDGTGEERRVTHDGDIWRFAPVWSPDGKRLAFGDKKQRLLYVDVDSGAVSVADRSDTNDITTYSWAPDSAWIVYTKTDDSGFSSVYVYSLDQSKATRLTDDRTNDYSPVFDPEGRYLYFLSDRDYNLTFSGYEFNYFYTDPTRIYAATLRRDGPPLMLPKNDEEQPAADEDAPAAEKKKKKKQEGEAEPEEKDKTVRIDFERFADRVIALPGESGNYRNLAATGKGLAFLSGDGGATALMMFSIEDEETKTVLEGVSGFDVSFDGNKVLYSAPGGRLGIVDLKPGQSAGDGALNLDDLELKVDPRAEWRQIFVDGWRITRDWFYDPGLHGVDWNALRELYEPLVEHVAHRGDLDYILGELGGELNAGHFYVNWGDMPAVERRDGGLLGAEIEMHESGYARIARILRGENWHADFRSPLTESGVEAGEGDFILSVNGVSTKGLDNFYRLLDGSAGKLVALELNGSPDREGARTEFVRPIARETNLRYLDWIRSRRDMVDRLSGGRIGYIHLPNTATDGNRELRKHFYPQSRKDALIFDVRYNGGGFIPDRMMELISRPQLSYWARRGIEPMRTPRYAHTGPKACLINGYSSSGGDAFPYYFRKLGLGPLIGTRTWGGLIGLSGNPSFVDGGSLAVPRFRFLDVDGNWAVENVGVAPDIEVVDRPDLVARGEDPTLERAVAVLLEQLRKDPPKPFETPAPPVLPR